MTTRSSSATSLRGIALALSASACSGWQNWTVTTPSSNASLPAPRRGHSMVARGASQVYLFGGVSNPSMRVHTPKTFEIIEVDDELQFKSYEDRAVLNCSGNTESACKRYPNVDVGVYLNDIWLYDVDCERDDDFPCDVNKCVTCCSAAVDAPTPLSLFLSLSLSLPRAVPLSLSLSRGTCCCLAQRSGGEGPLAELKLLGLLLVVLPSLLVVVVVVVVVVVFFSSAFTPLTPPTPFPSPLSLHALHHLQRLATR